MSAPIRMSVGRDYNTSSRYEYCLFRNEQLIARGGGYRNTRDARKAGFWKAEQIEQRDARAEARGFEIGKRAYREAHS